MQGITHFFGNIPVALYCMSNAANYVVEVLEHLKLVGDSIARGRSLWGVDDLIQVGLSHAGLLSNPFKNTVKEGVCEFSMFHNFCQNVIYIYEIPTAVWDYSGDESSTNQTEQMLLFLFGLSSLSVLAVMSTPRATLLRVGEAAVIPRSGGAATAQLSAGTAATLLTGAAAIVPARAPATPNFV